MGLEFVDELVEILGKSPDCTSKYLSQFLTVEMMGRLKEFG